MFLSSQDFSQKEIIKNSIPDNFYSVGYDLRILNIINPNSPVNATISSYDLHPGGTVFVSTKEDIYLPNTLVGVVVPKNSLIRYGLQIEAPVYQPGHHTKIFIRVTNISGNVFHLKEGDSIAAIMFEKISSPVDSYSGRYVSEFDYRGVPSYPTDTLPQYYQLEEKIKDINTLEESILNKVLTIMTVIISLFTLININLKLINDDVWHMISYNFITVGTISCLIGFISIIMKRSNKNTNFLLFGLAAALMIASCLIAYFKLV